MSVWAIARVKDEADVIAEVLGRIVGKVDHALVADNGSTDGTRDLLDEFDIEVIDDPEVGYYQSPAMSSLAERARLGGAEWVVPMDADEVWCAHGWSLSSTLAEVPEAALVAQARIIDHVATGIDPAGPPIQRMQWRRSEQLPLPKVACRALPGLVIHQGNHGASYPGVEYPLTVTGLLEIRHFPYRSVEQFVTKVRNGAAAYAATDLPEEVGAHWRSWGRILETQGEEAIADIFRTWYWRQDPASDYIVGREHQPPLVRDPCP